MRRCVGRVMGVTVCAVAWGIGVAVAEEAAAEGAAVTDPPDLEVVVPLPAGGDDVMDQRWVGFHAAVPLFEVGGGKLDPDHDKTRFMVGATFRSRDVAEATIQLAMLDADRNVLYERSRTEELGPERVVQPGHNLDLVRDWDTGRALWFDFPVDARDATSFRVRVRLTTAATGE